jgi:hypothetical protein
MVSALVHFLSHTYIVDYLLHRVCPGLNVDYQGNCGEGTVIPTMPTSFSLTYPQHRPDKELRRQVAIAL